MSLIRYLVFAASSLGLLSSQSTWAQSATVDESRACISVMQKYGPPQTDANYEKDRQTCESARRKCDQFRQTLAQHCGEFSPEEEHNEGAWLQSMQQAQRDGKIKGMNAQMEGFCPKYLQAKAVQNGPCQTIASHPDKDAKDRSQECSIQKWQLSRGTFTCNDFYVKGGYFIHESGSSMVGVCDMADQLSSRLSAELADRNSQCSGYAAGSDAANANSSGSTPGSNGNDKWTENNSPGEMGLDDPSYNLENKAYMNQTPTPTQVNAATRDVAAKNNGWPIQRTMPSSGVVQNLFNNLFRK